MGAKQNRVFKRNKRNRIRLKEQEAKAEAARVVSAAQILAKAKENVGRHTKLPAAYMTFRAAKVRQGRSLESEEVGIVPKCEVMVEEVVENRARISSPMKGWVSIATKNGLLLDFTSRSFPSLGSAKVYKEATVSYQEEQKKKKVKVSKKVATKTQPV